jgi:hypothetical protein
MRRLASRTREDAYSSNRDYQTLHEVETQALSFTRPGPADVVLKDGANAKANTNLIGFGGFFRPSRKTSLRVRLTDGQVAEEKVYSLRSGWNRVGLVIETDMHAKARATLTFDRPVKVSFWGVALARLQLPETVRKAKPTTDQLLQSHLAPETFYLPHDSAITAEIDEEQSAPFSLIKGQKITLKKCSYCQRLLPVDPHNLGALSFGKHNAKRTKHQNECRVCEKWHINNQLNPIRSTDQLHESSVITRERKVFLREPVILQKIKQRTGSGLKSQVWRRFGKRCFYCGKNLALKEVQLDHTRPLAYLWPIDEHATCLCTEHNNQKKEKFPVDFYSDEQLRELAATCGLPYGELRKKELNQIELKRILSDLPNFAHNWTTRTFVATARKVKEIRPELDLYERLRTEDEATYGWLMEQVENRPDAVVDDTED